MSGCKMGGDHSQIILTDLGWKKGLPKPIKRAQMENRLHMLDFHFFVVKNMESLLKPKL